MTAHSNDRSPTTGTGQTKATFARLDPECGAVIIGAGFGGMGAAIGMQRLGIDNFLILDREDDLGGTWHVNRYPGLAVDIPSMTYSYSFEPNAHWSRVYAPGSELKKYAESISTTYLLTATGFLSQPRMPDIP